MGDALRPVPLLDVDGPLNPWAAPPHRRPDGYQTHRVRPAGWDGPHDKPLRVWLNPGHGPMLLAATGSVDLAWCTTWGDDANDWIGPRIGLPPLPVVAVGESRGRPRGAAHWKVAAVEAWAGARPVAWVDDEFTTADDDWADARNLAGAPTLLVRIDPRIGLRADDLTQVREWAERVGNATGSAA